ncbi:MAG: ABC transporter ATP-binding protein [Candidatus Cloacimonetes bacterium]|nr:ABC transporter ATP-binding protein [Candidatus Cloacimonadota bacterium]
MTGISKKFGDTFVNKDVNFTMYKGEICALLGENGAGKSTLVNMLSGIYKPDVGLIEIKEKFVNFDTPKQAIQHGIGMIHQHFKLVDVMTAKENIIIGRKTNLFINEKKLTKQIKELSKHFDIIVDPDKKVYNMSVGEKQNVEILKVLYYGADILILDEPTAVLTPQETQKLFKVLRKMKERGCSVLIITHKLNEVMEISDRVVVMRKGEVVGDILTSETSIKKLTDMMVGQSIDLSIKRINYSNKQEIFQVKNLTVIDHDNIHKVNNVSFKLSAGEILGVAGITGSGQKELCEAIMSLEKIHSGDIIFENKNIVGLSYREILGLGIVLGFVPEDRLGMGLVAGMSLVDNIVLRDYYNHKGFFINKKPSKKRTENLVKKLGVQTPSIYTPIKQLSGGNIQKVLLGREIDCSPKLIITAYPTRGLDIKSSYLIYDLLNEQKAKGIGIIYVAEDLDVLLEISDRILVMCRGEAIGIVNAEDTNKEEIGLMMSGEKLVK